MKSALAIFALTFSLGSFAAELQINMHSTMTMKLIGKDTLEKINEVVISDTAFITRSGIRRETRKQVNTEKLTYKIEKSLVRIQDEKNGIDTDAVADVDRSIFGNVKGFTITGENLENVYFESLSNKGIIALANLDKKSNERKSLSIGDQVCVIEKSKEIATCEQDLNLKVENNELAISAALILLSLGQ